MRMVIVVALLSLAACETKQGNRFLLDVGQVMNKTPKEIEDLMGKPDTTFTEKIMGNEIFCQRYRTHNIEFQYRNGLSADVVVYGPHGLPFNQTALEAFNLPYHAKHPAQYEKDVLMRWYDLAALEAVSFYNVTKDSVGRVSNFNIYFKAKKM